MEGFKASAKRFCRHGDKFFKDTRQTERVLCEQHSMQAETVSTPLPGNATHSGYWMVKSGKSLTMMVLMMMMMMTTIMIILVFLLLLLIAFCCWCWLLVVVVVVVVAAACLFPLFCLVVFVGITCFACLCFACSCCCSCCCYFCR